MINRITLPRIFVFFLLSLAVDAQSSSPPVASPNASPHNRNPSFDPVLAFLVCVLLFAAFVSIFLRHCSNMDLAAGGLTGATANCSSSGPQGIDQNLLNTFPILVYSAAVKHLKFGKAAVNECAVCLSEFDQHDTLRLLPKCNHVFHPECIDAWLASHVTCPVCRSRLKPAVERDGGDNEVVMVIPNEVNAHQMFDESYASRTELNSGELRSLGRSRSTGHSLGFGEMGEKDTAESYTLTILLDVKKQIPSNHGGMRRSASSDVLRGWPGDTEK